MLSTLLILAPLLLVPCCASFRLVNRVKQNLAAGNSSYGAFVGLFDPAVTEIFGASGLDYLFIDAEHTQMTPAVLLGHLRAAGASGIVPLVRVPGPTNVDTIKPWVDAGALGIVVPNIYGVEDAQEAVNALKYKTAKYPNGTRRVGIGRATMYSEFIDDYLDEANEEVLVILMAERIELISSIDEVCWLPFQDRYCNSILSLVSCVIPCRGCGPH